MSKIGLGSEDPTQMIGDQLNMQTEDQPQNDQELPQQIGGVMGSRQTRGAVYKKARETALQSVNGNEQLTQIILAQKYREKRPPAARIQYTLQELSNAFGGVVDLEFFKQLQEGNEPLHKLVINNISGKKNGTGLSIKLPSSKYLTGTDRDLASQARRILRALRGIIQGRALKGNAFNAVLLRTKTRVQALKKLVDPHAYVVQLRNYISKYNSTDPNVIKQSASQNIRSGLEKAGGIIINKMNQGLDRTLNFPQTSTPQSLIVLNDAKRILAGQMQQLGLGASGVAAAVIPWENVR